MASVGERAESKVVSNHGSELQGAKERGKAASGMMVPRVFSTEGVSPFDLVEWDQRTAEIKDERGRVIFQQTDCEIPKG